MLLSPYDNVNFSQETRKLKNKLVKMPSLILEKARRPLRPDLGDDFLVHAICFNCWIGTNKNIDTWRAGRGLFLAKRDYFGEIVTALNFV